MSDHYLNVKRSNAENFLPKLQNLVDKSTADDKDLQFVGWVQEVVDYYMANVCELGRRFWEDDNRKELIE